MNQFLTSSLILAEDFGAGPVGKDFTIQSVFSIVIALTCYISRMAIVAMIVYIIWFGIKFLMSQGDPAEFTKARKSLYYGLIGIIVILGTYTIIATVANIFGADSVRFIPIDCSGY